NSCRWGTLHSVLPLHRSKPGADFGSLLLDSPAPPMAGQLSGKIGYWLIKSEPDVFSIQALRKSGKTHWEGVRNYQARNHLRAMQLGDLALYYHSNADPPGVAGVARVCREAYPDDAPFD